MSLFQKASQPILTPQAAPSWASGAVFNPGAWYDEARNAVHLLFRAVPAGYRRVEWEATAPGEPDHGFDDYVSYIGYARSTDGHRFDVAPEPFLKPDQPFSKYGVEDPRISCLDGEFLVTFTALSHPAFGEEDGVRIGLAGTRDFEGVERQRVIGPAMRDKDAVIFPRRVGGKIAMLHRIVPDIQIAYFDDVEHLFDPAPEYWQRHLESLDDHVLMRPEAPWERMKIGAGPTPIETKEGWLLIYHGVDEHYVYRAGLALLDLDDPRRVIARTAHPVMEPSLPFELEGDVNNVVFPEGAVVMDGTLHMYYGAADRVIGHATASLADVLDVLTTPAHREPTLV